MLELQKGKAAIGTTKRGIGPTYASKALRIGLRMGDLQDWSKFLEKYTTFIKELSYLYRIDNFDTNNCENKSMSYQDVFQGINSKLTPHNQLDINDTSSSARSSSSLISIHTNEVKLLVNILP